MKNKGFTLVEMLGIIVILLLISLFAFPSLNKMLKNESNMEEETFLKIIRNASEIYVETNYNQFEFKEKKINYIPITNLTEETYIDETLVNPKTKEKVIKEHGYIEVIKNNDNTLSYNYVLFEINKPNLLENMIPIYYDEKCKCFKKADKENISKEARWYDYVNGMWANIALVRTTKGIEENSKSRQEYIDAEIGTTILEEDILAYFVWIPRYEYKISDFTNYAGGTVDNPGAIDINFIKNTNSSSSSEYQINNAFRFGTKDLTGIWVSKFDTSAGNTNSNTVQNIYSKPNLISWRGASVSTMFTSARNMELYNNIYGFTQNTTATTVTTSGAGTYGNISNDENTIDIHMMKNNEWGAIAYLSQSLYGRCITKTNCPEILYNNSSSYYTGRSSGNDFTSTELGSYQYNTKEGVKASTTYNVYGVYDMSGGALKNLMANYNTGTNQPSAITNPASSGFTTSNYPNSKYINYYLNNTVSCGNTGNCYGHALEETNNWYLDNATFINTTNSWLIRGVDQNENLNKGLFSLNGNTGVGGTFRITIINE